MVRSTGLFFIGSAVVALAQTPCERLKALSLPNVTITAAETLLAGTFQAPGTPPPVPEAAQALPSGGDSYAFLRLPYRDGTLASNGELEWELSGRRKWWLGRDDYVRHRKSATSGAHDGIRIEGRLRGRF